MNATHFVLVYSVPCVNVGTREKRKDYCATEPRELKHLEPLLKCSPEENVAVFRIEPKPIIFKVGDIVEFSVLQGCLLVPVVGEIIETYRDLYLVDVDECSIKYDDCGDTCIIHGIDVRKLKKKGGSL